MRIHRFTPQMNVTEIAKRTEESGEEPDWGTIMSKIPKVIKWPLNEQDPKRCKNWLVTSNDESHMPLTGGKDWKEQWLQTPTRCWILRQQSLWFSRKRPRDRADSPPGPACLEPHRNLPAPRLLHPAAPEGHPHFNLLQRSAEVHSYRERLLRWAGGRSEVFAPRLWIQVEQ